MQYKQYKLTLKRQFRLTGFYSHVLKCSLKRPRTVDVGKTAKNLSTKNLVKEFFSVFLNVLLDFEKPGHKTVQNIFEGVSAITARKVFCMTAKRCTPCGISCLWHVLFEGGEGTRVLSGGHPVLPEGRGVLVLSGGGVPLSSPEVNLSPLGVPLFCLGWGGVTCPVWGYNCLV